MGRTNAEETRAVAVEHWPEDDQDELAQLRAIDGALAAVARGEIAFDEEVEAVFAK